jgi:hypothetical protein
MITGTPTATGSTMVAISATNANGTGSATLVITVFAAGSAPVITSPLSASGTVGIPFSYQITGSSAPTGFNATTLPPGLGVNTATGLISGTPTAAGAFDVTISGTDGGGKGSANLVVSILPSSSGGAGGGAGAGGSPSGHHCGIGSGFAAALGSMVLALRSLLGILGAGPKKAAADQRQPGRDHRAQDT